MKIKSQAPKRQSIIEKLDAYIRREAKRLENEIINALVETLLTDTEVVDGKVKPGNQSYLAAGTAMASIAALVAASKIKERTAKDTARLYYTNKAYFKQFGNIPERREKEILASVGLVKNAGGLTVNEFSWLGQLSNFDAPFARIKAEVFKSIAAGLTVDAFTKGIKAFIKKDNSKLGILEGHLITSVGDNYAKFDRSVGSAFKDELNLEYAFYQGGTIRTSRPMCEFLNNRIMHTSDIEKLRQIDFKGKNDNYDPYQDMGGHNCRHFWDWVDEATAKALGYVAIDFGTFVDEKGVN